MLMGREAPTSRQVDLAISLAWRAAGSDLWEVVKMHADFIISWHGRNRQHMEYW